MLCIFNLLLVARPAWAQVGPPREVGPPPFAPPANPDRPLPYFLLEGDDVPFFASFKLDLEYIRMFVSPASMPPLITTGPPGSLGIIGQPGVRVLIGGDVQYGGFNGFQFRTTSWFDRERIFGSDGASYFLEQRSRNYAAASDGSTLLARSFVSATPLAEAAATIAAPGVASGNLVVEMRTRFNNGDGNLTYNLFRDNCTSINALLGYRLAYFKENLLVHQNQQFQAPGAGFFRGAPLPAGALLTIRDRFENVTDVYAVQVGVRGERIRGRLALDGAVKVGLGWSHHRIYADGRTTYAGTTVPGGVLAQLTYPYRSSNDDFVVVPEVIGRVGFQVLERVQLYAAYNMVYISSVARPGFNIDREVNVNLPPSFPTFGTPGGRERPMPPDFVSDLFAHGISLGINIAF